MNYFPTLLKALRSGEYDQAIGQLYDGNGYCCLGLAEHVCLGIDFDSTPDGWKDSYGMDDLLAGEIASQLDLDEVLTGDEETKTVDAGYILSDSVDVVAGITRRQTLLAAANDGGASFKEIADLIELLGWDKDD